MQIAAALACALGLALAAAGCGGEDDPGPRQPMRGFTDVRIDGRELADRQPAPPDAGTVAGHRNTTRVAVGSDRFAVTGVIDPPTAKVKLEGNGKGQVRRSADGRFVIDVVGLEQGDHTLQLKATRKGYTSALLPFDVRVPEPCPNPLPHELPLKVTAPEDAPVVDVDVRISIGGEVSVQAVLSEDDTVSVRVFNASADVWEYAVTGSDGFAVTSRLPARCFKFTDTKNPYQGSRLRVLVREPGEKATIRTIDLG